MTRIANANDDFYRVAVVRVNTYNDGRTDDVFGHFIGPYTSLSASKRAVTKTLKEGNRELTFWEKENGEYKRVVKGTATTTAEIQIATAWEKVEL